MDSGFLLRELVKRDLSARYAGSLLGIVWSVLQPLWQLRQTLFNTLVPASVSGDAATTITFPPKPWTRCPKLSRLVAADRSFFTTR